MNVLSLFDGMSCGQIALNRAGFKVDNYFASEIDKYAISVARANYPNTKHIGSVTDINFIDGHLCGPLGNNFVGKIDILIGGSPCQSFSFAGSRKGMVTKDNVEILTLEHYLQLKNAGFEFQGQSYLFWEYVRLLSEVKEENPNVLFLLENVKMAKKWQDLISNVLGIQPIVINSALVSAQNRVRLYWTNIKGVTQPEESGVFLKDIIDYSIPFNKTYTPKNGCEFSKDRLKVVGSADGINGHDILKRVYCIEGKGLTLTGGQGGNTEPKISKPINLGNVNPSGRGQNGNVYSVEGLSPCLTTNKGEGVKIATFVDRNKSLALTTRVAGATAERYFEKSMHQIVLGEIRPATITDRRINEKGVRDDQNKAIPITQCLQVKTDPSKAPCLTTVEKDCLLSLEEPGRSPDAYNRPELLWRKLTPVECERLQTVPDNYTSSVSNSQRYRMLGNGWTVDVIAHIFKNIKN